MSKRLGGIIGCKYKTSSWHLNGFPVVLPFINLYHIFVGKFGIPNFPNFCVPKFGNEQAPRGRCLSISKFRKVGKLESLENMPLLLQPFWVTVLSLVQAKGNKDDRSAQAVQDEASLSPAASRAGFSMAPRPQVGDVHNSHSVAVTIRPPEVRMAAITREWLCWDDYSDKSEREGTFMRKCSRHIMRCAPGSADIYCGGLRILCLWDSWWACEVQRPKRCCSNCLEAYQTI